MTPEDKDLVRGLRIGDPAALCRIYERYKDDLLTVACCLLGDRAAAEDVLHDVVVSMAARHAELRINDSLRGYLATSVANRARDRIRRRCRQPAGLTDADDLIATTPEPATELGDGEESLNLDRALARLPYEQREVISLHLHADLTFKEIALEQGVSINTVQSRYRYGLDKLRSLLSAEVKS
jgi:RNA polymerase sigma-70 factor (ECF subfamily)